MAEPSQEMLRNALLRRVDWRFILDQEELPRAVTLASGRLAEAARLVTADRLAATGAADLVVVSRPTPAKLRAARSALRPGGALYCEWLAPVPGGAWIVRRALAGAGFSDIRLLWPWPPPLRAQPQFWIPLESRAAVAHLVRLRPARRPSQTLLRRAWGAAAEAGALAPLGAVALRPPLTRADDQLGALLHPRQRGRGIDMPATSPAWLLLTAGHRSVNKVVGVPFDDHESRPRLVVKFARLRESEPPLEHEAHVLRTLASERPNTTGIPRVLAAGRRAGRLAVAESLIEGVPLSTVAPDSFAELARGVTRWLIELAGKTARQPRASWWPRLVKKPLDEFERWFAAVMGPDAIARARIHLAGLPDLPLVCEHRDCAPWNIVCDGSGSPALLDWESAELRGLPALDLIYFLTQGAFLVEGALESGRTRQAYARLLDPATATGRVASACVADYCARLDIGADTLARLRLLCWIVHSRSEYGHMALNARRVPEREQLRDSVFLGLAHEELQRLT